jgi:translocation and assembly module TamB
VVQADLAKQPWFTATGAVNGEARLVSGISASPVVEFSLDARDVTARDVALSAVNAAGRLEWPRLTIASGVLAGGEGERLEWHGGWDFRAKEVLAAAVTGQIRRASIARWLPKQPEFDVVKIDAQAEGPVAQLHHHGRITTEAVKFDGLQPAAVAASWRGNGAAFEHFDADATFAATKLSAAGSTSADALRLGTLELKQHDAVRLALKAPAVIQWRPQLRIESLQLAGPEGSLTASATLGETGRLEISAREISSRWLEDIVPPRGPAWQLSLFALVGSWDRGPMTLSFTGGANVEIGEGRTASVMAAARGDKDGVRIEALRATEGNATFVNAAGRVPVTFTPAARPLVHIDEKGPLLLDAAVAPNSAFWEKLASMSGVELQEPQAAAHLAGTWQRPEGNVTLKARRVAVDPKRINRPLPTVESLDVRLKGDAGGVVLDTFSLLVEGQPLRAQGRLPVPEGQWAALFKNPLAAAQRGADLRVEVPDAEVAVFTRFLPAVLAPKGRLEADIRYQNGGLEGYLKLRDAASRPLGPLGVLQEISADIALSGRKLALRGVTARSGGQPVTLSGTMELPEKGAPQFDLALRGENLPFVRQTGLLLRGDLDLKLQTPPGAPPRLSGEVRLRDSLFLSDVRSFLPKGGAASPTRRPPYFAIETQPVNTWTLAVDLVGDQFMRMRTPVFSGVASARFRLSGTLGEPRATGQATINDGRVRMPFASFAVTQGLVRLTEADPFEPSIYLRGTARRWGYDLTMEIEGKASQPNVTFTSSPPLDSDQVLLMVMTGAAPTNEVKSGTQRMASIGYFLGQSLLGSLDPDAGDAERLSIASGEKVSRQGRETYDIEYRLSDRWALTGEYNEFDEYNAGIKWRVLRGDRRQPSKEHAKQ